MDDQERKMFVQMDDPMPAQRVNALEMTREYNLKKTPPRYFRDIAQEDETAGKRIAELQKEVSDEKTARAADQQNFNQAYNKLMGDYQQLLKRLSVMMWMRKHWQQLAVGAAVPMIAGAAWSFWPDETAMHREAVEDSFNALAAATPWQASGHYSNPVVRAADGQPYWVTARFDANAKHYDAEGKPVTVQCVHLYAAPAVADAGVYLKPHPFSLFGFGWLTWPERGVSCKAASGDHTAQMTPLPVPENQVSMNDREARRRMGRQLLRPKPSSQVISAAEASPTALTPAPISARPAAKPVDPFPDLAPAPKAQVGDACLLPINRQLKNCWAAVRSEGVIQNPRDGTAEVLRRPIPVKVIGVRFGETYMTVRRAGDTEDYVVSLRDLEPLSFEAGERRDMGQPAAGPKGNPSSRGDSYDGGTVSRAEYEAMRNEKNRLDAALATAEASKEKMREALNSFQSEMADTQKIATRPKRVATGLPGCPLRNDWEHLAPDDWSRMSISADSKNCIAVERADDILNLFDPEKTISVTKGTVVTVLGKTPRFSWMPPGEPTCDEVCRKRNMWNVNIRLADGRRGYVDALGLRPLFVSSTAVLFERDR